ncbi:MAG: hypothetical protein ACLFPJ_02280 [Candidatus Woesearchaeota archaeon]
MEKNNKFFKIYFILVLVYAIIGLLDSFVFSGMKETFGQISTIWMIIGSLFGLIKFILSIIALIIFIKKKFSKITLVIPIYHLVATVLLFIYGFAWGILSAVQGNSINEQLIPPGMIAIGIISSLFELIFSIYILSKFK